MSGWTLDAVTATLTRDVDPTPVVVDGRQLVGFYIDLGDPTAAVAEGDWIVSTSGSARYLVVSSRKVRPRIHTQRNRWQLRCVRLSADAVLPAGVGRVWDFTWYPRGRR
jgi:hypothetical protein